MARLHKSDFKFGLFRGIPEVALEAVFDPIM